METDLGLRRYMTCLPVRRWQNLHILTCLFEGFKSGTWNDGNHNDVFISHQTHCPTTDLQQQNNSQLMSKENTGIPWPLDLKHDQCIGRTASHWGWGYHVLLLLPSAGNRSRTFCPCTGYRRLKTAPMMIHEELSVRSKVGSNFIIGACKGLHMRQRLHASILQSLVCSRFQMIASCWLVSNRTRELVNHVDFSRTLLTFRCFCFPFTTSSKNGKWLDDKWTWITLLV